MDSDISWVVWARLEAASELMCSDFLSFLKIALMWLSSTDMNAFEGIRNWRIVASSEGLNADLISPVLAFKGFPSPANNKFCLSRDIYPKVASQFQYWLFSERCNDYPKTHR